MSEYVSELSQDLRTLGLDPAGATMTSYDDAYTFLAVAGDTMHDSLPQQQLQTAVGKKIALLGTVKREIVRTAGALPSACGQAEWKLLANMQPGIVADPTMCSPIIYTEHDAPVAIGKAYGSPLCYMLDHNPARGRIAGSLTYLPSRPQPRTYDRQPQPHEVGLEANDRFSIIRMSLFSLPLAQRGILDASNDNQVAVLQTTHAAIAQRAAELLRQSRAASYRAA